MIHGLLPQCAKLSDSYPKKHVFETESGHFMMYDDNDGNETIQQRHRSGTQYIHLMVRE